MFDLRTSLILSVVAFFLIVWNFSKSKTEWERIGYYFILGGGLVNFVERVFFKKTTDFIALNKVGYANLSDLVIFAGMILVVASFLCSRTQRDIKKV